MNVSPEDYGTIKVDQNSPPLYPYAYTFSSGTQVTIEAIPALDHHFNHWSGSLSGGTNPTTVVMDCDRNITANFAQIIYSLSIQPSGRGATTPAAGQHEYAKGVVVSLTANPDRGWRFNSWAGDVADPGSSTSTLIMNSDKTVTANFSINWPLLGETIGLIFVIVLILVIIIVRRQAYRAL